MQDASQDDFPLNAADHALAQMLPVGQGVAQAANAEVLATSVSQQGGNNDGEEEGDEEVEGVGDGEEEGDEEVEGVGDGAEEEGQGGEEGQGHGGEASGRKQKRQKTSPQSVRSYVASMHFVAKPKTGRPPKQDNSQPERSYVCPRCSKTYKKSDRLDYHFFTQYKFTVS